MRIAGLVSVIVIAAWSLTVAQDNVPQPRPPIKVRPLPQPIRPGGQDDLEVPDKPKPPTDAQRQGLYGSARLVMVATVADVEMAQVQTMIWPPRIGVSLKFEQPRMLRGQTPRADEVFQHTLVGQDAAAPNKGDLLLIAAEKTESNYVIKLIEPADDAKIKQVKVWVSVPLGWNIQNEKPVSPWADVKDFVWPKDAAVKSEMTCNKTGRPALAAAGAKLAVEQVIPPDFKKFENPYGDGIFKVSVTNPTEKPLVVPASLTDGKEILWADSLVFVVQDKTYTLPASGKLDAKVQSVTLKPGETVEANINTLHLKGVQWPRGGVRVSLTFCLGDISQQNFFYYLSRHHDTLLPK